VLSIEIWPARKNFKFLCLHRNGTFGFAPILEPTRMQNQKSHLLKQLMIHICSVRFNLTNNLQKITILMNG